MLCASVHLPSTTVRRWNNLINQWCGDGFCCVGATAINKHYLNATLTHGLQRGEGLRQILSFV
jgi:hypothetical protein